MAAKTGYDAGTVFLQVVPSYRNFMKKLRADLNGPLQKAMENEADAMMEKAGVKGGEKYADGVQKGVEKKMKRGKFAADAIKSLEKAMGDLGDEHALHDRMKTLQDDFKSGESDANDLSDALHDLQADLRKVGRESADIEIRTNADEAANSLERVSNSSRDYERQTAATVRAIKIQTAETARLAAEERRAEAATRRFEAAQKRSARATQGQEKASSGLRAKLRGLGSGTNDAANSFRFFNFAILAFSTIGPAIIPMLAAIAGGLAALGVAALGSVAALGVAGLALSGISGAVQALGAQQKATSSGSAGFGRAQVNAARQIADAQRSLADARRSASEGVRRALESQRQAELRLADAQRDSRKAQQDLTQARKEAKAELQDLASQIAQSQLDERQGVIDLFNAYTTYGATMADGGATNLEKEQASINLEQAELSLKKVRAEQKRLSSEKKKADKDGVNGTQTVIDAQNRVTEAVRAEKEARRDLKEASRDVDLARADGAREVADAQRNLNRAIEDSKFAAEGSTAALDNLNDAMRNLSPAAQKFARFIFGLREGFYELRAIAAENFLPGLQRSMERIISHYGPGFKGFVAEMSASLGRLSGEWADSFTSRPWRGFFRAFRGASVRMNEDLARAFMGFGEGLAEFFRAGIPTAERLTGWLEKIGKSFSKWSQSKGGRKDIREFWDYIDRIGPKVKDFFVSFGRFLISLGKALAPVGETVLDGLTKFFDYVSKMDPQTLRVLAGGILAIVAALQISTGLVSLISIISIIGGSPFIAAIAAIAALGAAFFFLSGDSGKAGKAMDKFQKALKPVFEAAKEIGSYIGGKFKELWESLQPAFESLAKTVTDDFLPAFERFWPVIEPVVKFLIDIVFGVIKGVINGIIDVVQGVLKILSGLMDFITGVFTGNWRLAWNGIKKIFGGIFQALWGIVQLWIFGKIFGGLKNIFMKKIPNMFKAAGRFFKDLLTSPFKYFGKWISGFIKGVLKAFRGMRDGAGSVFRAIGSWAGKRIGNPIISVVDFVINKALIGAVNKLLGWLNLGSVKRAPIPKKFARGGVLPGYSPGVDNHEFYSPTGGRLSLSGGEAIMRPEWTRAIGGSKAVARMNEMARKGMAFAGGGVVWPSKTRALSANYAGHTGVDIRAPYGSAVYASKGGRVISAPRWNHSYGHHVRVAGGGVTAIYAHLSRILTRVGAMVRAGQQIGRVGSTGNSTGPHLHFEVRPGGTYGSALAFLRGSGKPSGKAVPSIWDKLSSGAIKALSNPIDFIKDRVSGAFGRIGGLSGGLGKMVRDIPGNLYDKIFGWMKKKAGKALGVTGKFFGSAAKKISDVFGYFGGGPGPLPGGGGKPKLYDQGGYLPPGYSTVLNKTGRPEPVLTAPQWDKIMAGAGGGDTYHIPVNVKTDADPEEIADAINFALKRSRRRR